MHGQQLQGCANLIRTSRPNRTKSANVRNAQSFMRMNFALLIKGDACASAQLRKKRLVNCSIEPLTSHRPKELDMKLSQTIAGFCREKLFAANERSGLMMLNRHLMLKTNGSFGKAFSLTKFRLF